MDNLNRTIAIRGEDIFEVVTRVNWRYARKFSNLMPFGCWWFLNQPSIIEEITRERLESLGTSFIPQHSDARVLEQLIPKWRETRRILAPVLAHAYECVIGEGRAITCQEIRADLDRLLRSNFSDICGLQRCAPVAPAAAR